ncbi:hypothetical protein LINPERHAP1_LOCUS34468 [Linum perenne]
MFNVFEAVIYRYGSCFKTSIFGSTHVFVSTTESAKTILNNDSGKFSKRYIRSIGELFDQLIVRSLGSWPNDSTVVLLDQALQVRPNQNTFSFYGPTNVLPVSISNTYYVPNYRLNYNFILKFQFVIKLYYYYITDYKVVLLPSAVYFSIHLKKYNFKFN